MSIDTCSAITFDSSGSSTGRAGWTSRKPSIVRRTSSFDLLEFAAAIVWDPTEHLRRWGYCYGCPEHALQRQEGARRILCPYNSRRLEEIPAFSKPESETARIASLHPKAHDVGGNQQVAKTLRRMSQCKTSERSLRCKHYHTVPWLFSCADSVEGALLCWDQVRSRPLAEHDPRTQLFMAEHGQDLDARRQGGPLSDTFGRRVH